MGTGITSSIARTRRSFYNDRMKTGREGPDSDSKSQRRFATTRWSVVLAAGGESSPEAETALATLCETYWFPLYAYVRRRGYGSAEAQDLTQGFFTRLLEKEGLRSVRRDRGRFRSFLLASVRNFLINEWDRTQALKRGAGRPSFSINVDAAERRYQSQAVDDRTPEVIYERQWALSLLDRVQEGLRDEHVTAGKEEWFDVLSPFLSGGDRSLSYRELAADLAMTEAAVKVAIHRLRRRFRERLRREIAQTVATEEEVDDEIRGLFDALRS